MVFHVAREKMDKMYNIINLASTGLRRSNSLANKPKKYGLFAILSLEVIGSCGVDKNPHIFITRSNQHIQEVNRHFD